VYYSLTPVYLLFSLKPVHFAFTVFFVHFPLSFVEIATLVHQLPFAFFLPFDKVACVDTAVLEPQLALAFSQPILVISLISDHFGFVVVLTVAFSDASFELAFEKGAIRPQDLALAFDAVDFEVTGVDDAGLEGELAFAVEHAVCDVAFVDVAVFEFQRGLVVEAGLEREAGDLELERSYAAGVVEPFGGTDVFFEDELGYGDWDE
jgi:hypothetical protein